MGVVISKGRCPSSKEVAGVPMVDDDDAVGVEDADADSAVASCRRCPLVLMVVAETKDEARAPPEQLPTAEGDGAARQERAA